MRTSIKGKVLKTAFIDTLPILAAFLILGMGFGVLMSDAGYSPFFVLLIERLHLCRLDAVRCSCRDRGGNSRDSKINAVLARAPRYLGS
jgi:hypothetical protein